MKIQATNLKVTCCTGTGIWPSMLGPALRDNPPLTEFCDASSVARWLPTAPKFVAWEGTKSGGGAVKLGGRCKGGGTWCGCGGGGAICAILPFPLIIGGGGANAEADRACVEN